MKPTANLFVLVFLVGLGAFGAVMSLTFRHLEAMTLPLVLSSVLLVMAAVQLALGFRTGGRKASDTPARAGTEARVAWSRLGLVVAVSLGFFALITLLGFRIATLVFVFGYLRFLRQRGWSVSAGFAVAVTILIYLIFEVALKAQLFKGLLFGG